ncbi:bacteriohemerythrin [Mariprofundus sp. EBB-1]|uniref:bacteriohemerythrin n=1 Tax=Mariprofundus sp. EBB-1 TaxID=2650971 RepID=UPI00137B4ABF|nr:bacteriohemerythrin [Mariprofundus sp. EBB-1]
MKNDAVEFFEVFPWNANFETGVALIDEQHKQLVHLLNLLAAHLAHQSAPVKLNQVFDELAAYADYHFKAEEAIWQPYFKADSRFISHQHTHDSFITQVLRLKEEEGTKSLDEVIEDVLKFLTHWLAYHILDSDKRMAKTILAVDSGLTLEQAVQQADREMSGSMKLLIDTVMNMYDTLSSRTLDLMKEKAERKRYEKALQKAHDDLELRVAERTAELRKTEERFRLMINSAPLPMAVNDNGQNITLLNEKFVEMFGYTLADIPTLEAWWPRAYPDPEYRQQVMQGWDDAIEKARHSADAFGPLEFNVTCKDGTIRDILFSMAKIDDNSSLVIFHDLTERNKMEEALAKSQEQFYQAQKMEAVGTLVGGIAHDFNNMLAGITGNLYLVKKRTQDMPDVTQKLSDVEALSFRAANMIQQLLTFARKGEVVMKPIALTPFVKEMVKFMRSSIPENIVVHQELCSDDMQVIGDVTQLHQVLMNLINNARDAVEGAENPSITIKLNVFHADDRFVESNPYFKVGDYALLNVEDNGCGIGKDQLDHIFDPFFTTKEQGRGTGLGLAMVFGAIKMHEGYIEVESSLDIGTAFHIYMPMQQLKEIVADASDSPVMTGNGEVILIVDDDEMVRASSREILESMNYQICEASDGLEAIDVFKNNKHDIALAIVDVVMPKLGGIDAVKRIREIQPDVKIIFSTGYDKSEVLSHDQAFSGDVVISKPVNIDELGETIRQLLDE